MNNPFRDLVKADELPPDLSTKLFVHEASPIWTDLQLPISHIVVGARGTGKTIALRQLDHRIAEPRRNYAGVYLQISRVSTIFKDIMHTLGQSECATNHALERAFADYLWLEVIRDILNYAKRASTKVGKKLDAHSINGLTDNILQATSLEDAEDQCFRIQRKIEQGINSWSISGHCDWKPCVEIATSLHRVALALREIFPFLDRERPSLFLLFDESSRIPSSCQRVINSLFHRGRAYCTKLAIRPFDWNTWETNARDIIELDTDATVLFIEYSNELESQYIAQMKTIVTRLLQNRSPEPYKTHPPDSGNIVDEIFIKDSTVPYSGFPSICAASSGNPQNLLSICSCIFATAIARRTFPSHTVTTAIDPRIQHDAIVLWSRDYEERNPDMSSKLFCRALLKNIKEQVRPKESSIAFKYVDQVGNVDQVGIFDSDCIPPDIAAGIQPAFSVGFLRPLDASGPSIDTDTVLSRFRLSRGLLPRHNLSLHLPISPETPIDRDFISKHTAIRPIMSRRLVSPRSPERLNAFLVTGSSTAASYLKALTRSLQERDIYCVYMEHIKDEGLRIRAIYKEIARAQLVIVDMTKPGPEAMLGLGMAAAKSAKPVVGIALSDLEGNSIDLGEILKPLPLFVNTSTNGGCDTIASEIRQWNSANPQVRFFDKVLLTRTSLRPRQRDQCLYISLSISMGDVLTAIRRALKRIHWSVITDAEMDTFHATPLQTAVQSAHTARVATIDVSPTRSPADDLLQFYRLGIFAGKRAPWHALRIRSVQDKKYSTPLLPIPGIDDFEWQKEEDLVQRIRGLCLACDH